MLMRFENYSARTTGSPRSCSASAECVRSLWPADADRRGNEFKVHLDLPGVDPGSIELTVEKDVLSGGGATRTWVPAEGDQIQMAERAQGEFSRQLFLGESLDREQITAAYENGVLTATIPVAEAPSPARSRSPTQAVSSRR